MKGRLAGVVARSLRSIITVPSGAIYVPSGFKMLPCPKNDNPVWSYTDNLQYCTALLVKPRDVTPESRYAFAHIEAIENKDDSGLCIELMIEELLRSNNANLDDLMATLYSIYYSTELNPSLSSLANKTCENKDFVERVFLDCGVTDISLVSGSSSTVKCNGLNITEVGSLSRAASYAVDKIAGKGRD